MITIYRTIYRIEASKERLIAIAKDASSRAARNAGVAPELLLGPILWALQDAAEKLGVPEDGGS